MPTVLEVADFLGARDQLSGIDAVQDWPTIRGPAPVGQAAEGDVSFISASDQRGLELLRETGATLVLVPDEPDLRRIERVPPVTVGCANPRLSFIRLVDHFFAPERPTGIHPSAVLADRTTVPASAYIGPLATLGADVSVGERTVIHAGVHVYAGCTIGADCTIHPGTVVGSDGFGFERSETGAPRRFPHLGTVMIEDDVEIGANSCIDRATLGATAIRSGARIDNLVYIAHGVEVGHGALVMTLTSVGGGSRLGARSWISPSATLRDHVLVGDGATVGLGAVVVADVAAGSTVAGNPARPLAELEAANAAVRDLVARRGDEPSVG